jgi:hypothetical protein
LVRAGRHARTLADTVRLAGGVSAPGIIPSSEMVMQMSEAPFQFSESFYQCGKGAFCEGESLAEMFDRFGKRDLSNPQAAGECLSFALGFFDALIDRLRRPITRAELHQAGAELRPFRSDRPEEKIR